ncbi:hypothetical protein CHS0354_031344 [Potamilus streckersoni]|uniref:Uncharacterized protein n=1 Tax=Potamilus streckersoni TaxID=2493646 RepID=A0AAE0SJU6_9BIVA|nr:hypothetical protein CHS0354_031344 [Potamilus streckersoni]
MPSRILVLFTILLLAVFEAYCQFPFSFTGTLSSNAGNTFMDFSSWERSSGSSQNNGGQNSVRTFGSNIGTKLANVQLQSNISPETVTAYPWASGPTEWVFPVRLPPWVSTCQETGCPQGTHCTLFGSPCPFWISGAPCTCRPGCRVDQKFIPITETRTVDACNNSCTCEISNGQMHAVCTTNRC